MTRGEFGLPVVAGGGACNPPEAAALAPSGWPAEICKGRDWSFRDPLEGTTKRLLKRHRAESGASSSYPR